jgi:AraC-like DNA-binding protein
METALNLYDLLTASVFILNIFVAGIFFIRNFKISLTHKLISCILFLLLIRSFSIHLYLSNEIVHYPHFLLLSHLVIRIGLPIVFLMLVFEVYQRKFKWYDVFHFIPALLFFANYWSFYTKSSVEKVADISNVYSKGYDSLLNEGSFLSNDVVYLIRVIPFMGYTIAMGVILFINKKSIALSNSLRDFFIALTFYLFLNLVTLFFPDSFYLFNDNSIYEINIIGFITTFIMLAYFFFIPNFLYRPYFESEQKETQIAVVKSHKKITTHNHLEKIEQYFNLHKTYLNPDYTITQLEQEIKIPARQISKAIKLIRNQNFNQFLNEYRINYLLNHVTLETALATNFQDLAYQVGFNSVNNFYAHFKNYVGCTPKVYFDNLKKQTSNTKLP